MNSPVSVHPGFSGAEGNEPALDPIFITGPFIPFCLTTNEYASLSAASGVHETFAVFSEPFPDSYVNAIPGVGTTADATVVGVQLWTALISAITSSFVAALISSRARISGCASTAACAFTSGCPTIAGIATVISSPL